MFPYFVTAMKIIGITKERIAATAEQESFGEQCGFPTFEKLVVISENIR